MENTISKLITRIFLEESIHTIVDFIKTYTGSSIDAGEYDWNVYKELNKLIFELYPSKFLRYRSPTTDKELYELEPGVKYTVKLPKYDVWLVVSSYKTESKIFPAERHVRVVFHGKGKYKCRDKFIYKLLSASKGKLTEIEYMGADTPIKCKLIPTKLDNIILKEDKKNELYLGIANWKESKDWYINHGLVYKMGILLYGEPGTGKSTITRAISSLCGNAPILPVSPQNIQSSISKIIEKRNRTHGILIVLIEDFDMFCKKRNDDDNNEETKEQKEINQANQNYLFQLLDGVYSTENTIYIATTNHIKKLDPALIRYGRFDIQLELCYFDRSDCIKFVEKFGYNESVLDDMNLKYPVSPAYLQSELMRIRSLKLKGELNV